MNEIRPSVYRAAMKLLSANTVTETPEVTCAMSELCWLLIGPQTADEQQLRPETFIHHSAASLCPAADGLKGDQQNYKLSRRGIIMDLDSIEGMNEIRPSVYRAAMKLLSLQKLCHMDVVFVRHITAALRSVGGVKQQQDVVMNREEVTRTLNRMFHSVSQDVPGHVTVAAPEETCSLMMRLFDRSHSGCVSARSLQTALIALSADNLLLKFRGLVSVSGNSSGSVSRSGLRSLLQDLSQVLTPTASEEHVMSWLQSEPRLLLWLPTLYRLSVGQNISHNVRCHTCKTLPITGLRYRCMKCVNVHVCQSCFLTDRQSRKHKIHHPVLEFCTQPTWRESLSSLMRRARHSLLPRRYTQREADRQRVLMWAEPAETQDRAPPPSDASSGLADPAHSPSSDGDVSHDASGRRPSPPQCSTKALQTDEETPSQQASLLTEVRNLQRDRWLLEQQLQAWRLTVQSEQGVLEDRCSEMEVTMETLRQHNTCLQGMLTQALDKMEAQTHANNTPEHVENTEEGNIMPSSDTEEEEKELMKAEEEWSEDELQTPSPTIHQGSPLSHDQHCEEESADDVRLHHPIGPQDRPEEAELHRQDTCPSGGGGGDCGKCIPEELLQERVDRLKTEMETDGWTERQTGEIKGAELLQAADQVGQSVQQLVDAVRTK